MTERADETRAHCSFNVYGHCKTHASRHSDMCAAALAQARAEQPIQHVCTHCGYIAETHYGATLRERVAALEKRLARIHAIASGDRADDYEDDTEAIAHIATLAALPEPPSV